MAPLAQIHTRDMNFDMLDLPLQGDGTLASGRECAKLYVDMIRRAMSLAPSWKIGILAVFGCTVNSKATACVNFRNWIAVAGVDTSIDPVTYIYSEAELASANISQ